MPLFIYLGRDSERAPELRERHRPKHLAHLEPLDAAGRIRFAGPLLDDEGAPCGSVIVFEANDLAAARVVAQGDPYRVEGVFDRLEVFETRAVFPSDSAS